ncbi:hypothetical protein QJS66_06335 [Kocuria rhizophila]|nr:hypothetical protein QJS66_06335 [Kocuria rhizophila]
MSMALVGGAHGGAGRCAHCPSRRPRVWRTWRGRPWWCPDVPDPHQGPGHAGLQRDVPGTMPANDLVVQHPFDNRLNHPAAEGGGTTLRSGTGDRGFRTRTSPGRHTPAAVRDGNLTVVENGRPGNLRHGGGVTELTVTTQRVKATAWGASALLCPADRVGVRRTHRGVRVGGASRGSAGPCSGHEAGSPCVVRDSRSRCAAAASANGWVPPAR